MPRITRDLAARLARKLAAADTWDAAREVCDSATGRGLHAAQLDMLTDWTVEARVAADLAPERRGRFRALAHKGTTIAELAAVFGLPVAPDAAA